MDRAIDEQAATICTHIMRCPNFWELMGGVWHLPGGSGHSLCQWSRGESLAADCLAGSGTWDYLRSSALSQEGSRMSQAQSNAM